MGVGAGCESCLAHCLVCVLKILVPVILPGQHISEAHLLWEGEGRDKSDPIGPLAKLPG